MIAAEFARMTMMFQRYGHTAATAMLEAVLGGQSSAHAILDPQDLQTTHYRHHLVEDGFKLQDIDPLSDGSRDLHDTFEYHITRISWEHQMPPPPWRMFPSDPNNE